MKPLPYQATTVYEARDEYTLGLEIVVRASDILDPVHLIGKIVPKLCGLGCEILSVRVSDIVQETANIVIIIRKHPGKENVPVDELVNEINAIEGVLRVKPMEKIKNILYTELLFPPMVLTERVVLSGRASMEGLLVESRKQLGEIANVVIYRVGYFVGKRLYERYANIFLEKKTHSEIKNFLKFLFVTAGWGKIDGYEVDRDGTILIGISDLWEKWITDENSLPEKPEYTIGLLKGFFEKTLERPVEITSTIQWKGNRELILFFITPQ